MGEIDGGWKCEYGASKKNVACLQSGINSATSNLGFLNVLVFLKKVDKIENAVI